MGKSLFEETVNNRIHILEELLCTSKNILEWDIILEDLDNLKSILGPEEHIKHTLLENFELNANSLKKFKFLWNSFRSFQNQTNTKIPNIPAVKNIDIPNSAIFQLTHDFYKQLDNEYFNIFLSFYNDKDSNVLIQPLNKNHSVKGTNYYIETFNENFCVINKTSTVDDVLTSIHEFAHGTSALLNPYHTATNKFIYGEVDSIFMELVATDYLKNIFKDNSSIANKLAKHNSYCAICDDIIDKITLTKKINIQDITVEKFKLIARKKILLNEKELKNLLQSSAEEEISYLLSYMIAIQFYNLYIKDPEKSMCLLKKFILVNQSNEYDYYNYLLSQGIYPTKGIKSYHNNIKSEALILTRKPNNL